MNVRAGAATFACAIALLGYASNATAATYKCEVDGKTVYGDRPCPTGRQSEVDLGAQGPLPADRAAAAARARDDRKTLDALERDRVKREKAEKIPARAGSDRNKQVQACSKLSLRAKRAHEDYDRAAGKDRPKVEVRMRRADEDFAAFCKKR